MPWTDAFHEHEAIARAKVMGATWGHLAPKAKQVYAGSIVFTYGAYGDHTVISCDFEDLPDSPWFFQDLNDFVAGEIEKRDLPGGVWRFDGTYRKFKTGGFRFSGKVRPQRIVDRFRSAAKPAAISAAEGRA